MAEAVALLGVAAAALQFAEIGYKVISKCSFLIKKNREYAEYLQRTHSQMQHLLYLAKVAAGKTATSEVITYSEVQCATNEQEELQSANIQPGPLKLENIWNDCSRQAEIIDEVLQSMIREIEGRSIIEKWKKIRLHDRLCNIEKALGELERSKTMLGLWLGNESLCRMGHIHHDLAIMHDKIVRSEKLLSCILEEYHKKGENTVIAAIQSAPAIKPLDAITNNKKVMYTDFNKHNQHRLLNTVIPYSANKKQNLNKANFSITRGKGKTNTTSNFFFSNFVKVEWSKMLTFAGNTIIFQLGSHGEKPFTSASENNKITFLSFYLRLRTTWLFDLIELKFSLQQDPSAPSIQASLNAQTRVNCLPLHTFFMDIYGRRLGRNKLVQKKRTLSQEEQVQLFFIARKLLLQNFYAGDASPSDVNAKGQTLLHLQAELYRPGYEIFFMKMSEFLIHSMRVDTEVVDDELKTAQNTLCDNLLFYRKFGDTVSHTFPHEAQLLWTGFLKRRRISALEILHCIWDWPEAILDTEYEHICDIVLRKSIDDLQNLRGQRDLDSVEKGELISPLHFAAAASWPAGVETLISMGYSRFRVDQNETPLDIAIKVRYIPVVEILLRGDCLELLASSEPRLPQAFREAAETDDSRLHDITIECLLRHKFLLPRLLPYHDLARQWYGSTIKFAQKLFIAGFQDIEAYDASGYTSLMVACTNGNIRFASFLLQHGADPYKYHEYVGLRAGHFLSYDPTYTGWCYFSNPVGEHTFRSEDDEKKLLEAAFDTSIDIGSRCRCSPDGFSPIAYLFQTRSIGSTYDMKESFQCLISNIDFPSTDMKRYWRNFVVGETFSRLGMTHTCLKILPEVQHFPDNKRIGIEDEENELFFELEEIAARFDLISENFDGDLSKCVNEFFDDLDRNLRPRPPFANGPAWPNPDLDCLGPGEYLYVDYFLSSRGQVMNYGYKEIIREESMLRWLFS